MEKGGLFKSNLAYVLWFAFYFFLFLCVLGFTLDAFVFLLIIYGIMIILALNPYGEILFRLFEGMRPVSTKKEKDYLLPIFDEVYTEVRKANPNIRDDIELYVIDTISPNAMALGKTTIAVTKGLVEIMTEQQLKALLCHEFGHIIHGDTKATLLTLMGNGLFSIAVIIARIILKFCQIVADAFTSIDMFVFLATVMSISVMLFSLAVEVGIFVIKQVGDFILMANSRANEYFADEYSSHVGYGEELISALYEFQNIHINQKMNLIERLKSTHPYLAERIKRLEEKE